MKKGSSEFQVESKYFELSLDRTMFYIQLDNADSKLLKIRHLNILGACIRLRLMKGFVMRKCQ